MVIGDKGLEVLLEADEVALDVADVDDRLPRRIGVLFQLVVHQVACRVPAPRAHPDSPDRPPGARSWPDGARLGADLVPSLAVMHVYARDARSQGTVRSVRWHPS